jgi:hypothetical protein
MKTKYSWQCAKSCGYNQFFTDFNTNNKIIAIVNAGGFAILEFKDNTSKDIKFKQNCGKTIQYIEKLFNSSYKNYI